MLKKFPTPYIVYYPAVSRDGMPFPVNKCIREIQGPLYDDARAWLVDRLADDHPWRKRLAS